MAPHTTSLTTHRNFVIRRHLTTLIRHVLLIVDTEFLLSVLGASPGLRIIVEVAAVAAAQWRMPW